MAKNPKSTDLLSKKTTKIRSSRCSLPDTPATREVIEFLRRLGRFERKPTCPRLVPDCKTSTIR